MSMISEQIEELRLMAEMFANGEPYGNLLRRAASTIEMLSKKARESKQGEWKVLDTHITSIPVYWSEEQREADEKGAGISEHCECSVCGWRTSFMGYKKLGCERPFNFCPNCGARMKGADDERVR